MTHQSESPASQPSDSTVPLVPDGGYTQPYVPSLEDTAWPDFSYDDRAGDALFGASEPTVDYGSPVDRGPAPTTPMPYLSPQAGTAYQQPAVPPYQPQPAYQQPQPQQPAVPPYQPQPAYQQPQPQQPSVPPYQPQPAYQQPVAPEPSRYETYQPYTPPVPVAYSYPIAVPSAPEHPNAVAALVLGIAGLFVLPILAPVAWFVAGRGRREMAQYPGRWAPSGSLTAGFVLGIIGTLLWGALLAFFMLIFVLAVRFGA